MRFSFKDPHATKTSNVAAIVLNALQFHIFFFSSAQRSRADDAPIS